MIKIITGNFIITPNYSIFLEKLRCVYPETFNSPGEQQGRIPDVSVVKESIWNANVTGYEALREPIQLAVEVSSTNWDDD